ncbi:hypothetical protein Sste5346_006765 [Sporothrix stenoceras]|uniref:Uncharacterized protein n=1 Tax=Sporothrix stenoceras TaxID=5173 RepID=A0ABR3YY86_9PEZI
MAHRFPPNTRSRRRRRQHRHTSSVGSDSSPTTSSSSSTSNLPPITQLYSFPPFRENGSAFRRHTTRFFSHVTRLVRGGTALLWQTTAVPLVDDDDIGDYAKAICLPIPRLGAQADPVTSSYDYYYNSDMTLSSPMFVFPTIDCGKPCCGSL